MADGSVTLSMFTLCAATFPYCFRETFYNDSGSIQIIQTANMARVSSQPITCVVTDQGKLPANQVVSTGACAL